VFDWVLAVGLAAAAIVDASTVVPRAVDLPLIASCLVCTGSVAWRRASPLLMTVLAMSGYVALVVVSGYDGSGTFEWAAVASTSYTLGRGADSRRRRVVATTLGALWLVGCVVIFYVPSGGSVGVVLSLWLVAFVAFAVGRSLVTRRALTCELAARAAQLEDEQDLGARRAVAEERNRIARELHDVIAHCVSVMVVQTSAARSVAPQDVLRARKALGVVEGAGRDALVELRRMVGVLRRDSDQNAAVSMAGLSQLEMLADRARAAGLEVALELDDPPLALSPGLDLVAYRVVQEALTNAIKHAGPTSARVAVRFTNGLIELDVSDTGRAAPLEHCQDGSGHGLLGMTERVALYGGQLRAGPRPDGGFGVTARIPLDGTTTVAARAERSREGDPVALTTADRLRWRWFDPLLAVAVLVDFAVAVLSYSTPRGPLILNMLVVAAMALVTVWRRRWPVLFCVTIWVLSWVMNNALTPLSSSALPKVFLFVAPLYTLAAWTPRRTAVAGLAFVLASAVVNYLFGPSGYNVADYAGVLFVFLAVWVVGRAFRARRLLAADLERMSVRLAAEREDRAQLAIAGERSRIARELHSLVARNVAAMVIQTEAARSRLDLDPAQADNAMGAVETTGRQALTEMRRILGVLRQSADTDQLAPQPGVDQIYALIKRAREDGQHVELNVDGDPGTLPAGVELGLYRILEDALYAASQRRESPIKIAVRFRHDQLELQLATGYADSHNWPTSAMCERVALCGGKLNVGNGENDGFRVVVNMPLGQQGVLA
jgi:signal transduction histidine kinase